MKARLVEELPRGLGWSYEIKFDGVRALAINSGRSLTLLSRNAKDLSRTYPEIREALRRLGPAQVVLDGEVVAVDPEGRSSFQLLQSCNKTGPGRPPLYFYVFDLLSLEGRDVQVCP